MALEAIIFDVDGTLAETEELHRTSFNKAFAASGFPWSWAPDLYQRLLHVTGGKERISHFLRDIVGDCDFASDHSMIAALHRRKTEIYVADIARGACVLRPGVRDLIRSAHEHGLQLAIATTTTLSNVESLLMATLGSNYPVLFRTIVAGDMVPHKKPAADVYIAVLERLGLAACQCLAIEDSRNGLLAAKSAEIATIVTRSYYTSDQDFNEASLVLDTLLRLIHEDESAVVRANQRFGDAILDALKRVHAKAQSRRS